MNLKPHMIFQAAKFLFGEIEWQGRRTPLAVICRRSLHLAMRTGTCLSYVDLAFLFNTEHSSIIDSTHHAAEQLICRVLAKQLHEYAGAERWELLDEADESAWRAAIKPKAPAKEAS